MRAHGALPAFLSAPIFLFREREKRPRPVKKRKAFLAVAGFSLFDFVRRIHPGFWEQLGVAISPIWTGQHGSCRLGAPTILLGRQCVALYVLAQ